jgi:hypothetical protein
MLTVLRAMLRAPEGRVILAWAVLQVLIGTLVFRWLEGWSTIDSLYFSVVTLATDGFGDLHPTTDAAKLFTILYILMGLGVIAAFISELTKYRAEAITKLTHHDAPHAGPPTTDDAP